MRNELKPSEIEKLRALAAQLNQQPLHQQPPVIDVEVVEVKKNDGLKTAIKILKGVAAVGAIAGTVAGILEWLDKNR